MRDIVSVLSGCYPCWELAALKYTCELAEEAEDETGPLKPCTPGWVE